MLWDRYSIVFSNTSNFSPEKLRFKLSPCIFSLFWAGNTLSPLTKSITPEAKSQNRSWYMRKEWFHCFYPCYKKCYPLSTACLLHWRSSARVFKAKREASRGFLKLTSMEPHTYVLGTSWSSRSSLFGSYLHLMHEIINHTYPPIPLNTSSSPMGEGRKNCVVYPKSIKIILDSLEGRSHWKELSTPRHKGCSLSNHF